MSGASATVVRGSFKSEKDALISGAQNDLGSARVRAVAANKALASAHMESQLAQTELLSAMDRLREIALRQEED